MTSETTLPKPFIFVLMPFDKAFDDIYKFGIKGAADDVGAYAERIDEQLFAEGILDRIFNQISKADIIVADMSGRNPNVFYEVGYAHALGKRVILLTQQADDIPFDLKHRHHIIYDGKIDTLRAQLAPRLQWGIGEERQRQLAQSRDLFSLQILNVPVASGISPLEPASLGGAITKQNFSLPLLVRNDGPDTIFGITHLYLFAAPDAPIVPHRMVSSEAQPLKAYRANDATDGLTNQYRLPNKFGTIPPGAMEETSVLMLLLKDRIEGDAVYRVRLHSSKEYHDYTFRLKINLKEASKLTLPSEDIPQKVVRKRRKKVSP